ncbi:hypothetical protein [Brevibacillus massiliensis]|jgi:hypothetical protein|uniref:hypothetical protein n=1 Tax=Brevibacillus massiliensis TaxID=1118054 RepID=UPI0002D88121|nr:hypothetical protein [Brevibacillus massiliensis]
MKRQMEYFIEAIGDVRLDPGLPNWYRFSERWWGIDEYDALTKAMLSHEKQAKMEKGYLIVRATVRATGRHSQGSKSPYPFDACYETNPNVKGDVTRAWLRLQFCETEDKLHAYYRSIKEKYAFDERTWSQVEACYLGQLQRIRSGEAGPIRYELRHGLPKCAGAKETFLHYVRRAVELLRLSGYRVQREAGRYLVQRPLWLDPSPFAQGPSEWRATPLDLILICERMLAQRQCDVIPVMECHGYVFTTEEKLRDIFQAFEKQGIMLILDVDDVGAKSLYTLAETARQARDLLSSLQVKLVADYTDPDAFRKSDGLPDDYDHNLDNMFEW